MIQFLARLWHLPSPTCDQERQDAQRRAQEQREAANIDVSILRTHRVENHLSDRFKAALEGESRWN